MPFICLFYLLLSFPYVKHFISFVLRRSLDCCFYFILLRYDWHTALYRFLKRFTKYIASWFNIYTSWNDYSNKFSDYSSYRIIIAWKKWKPFSFSMWWVVCCFYFLLLEAPSPPVHCPGQWHHTGLTAALVFPFLLYLHTQLSSSAGLFSFVFLMDTAITLLKWTVTTR